MAKRKRSSAKTNGVAAGPAPSPANKRPRVDDAGVDADDDDLTTTDAKASTAVRAAAAPVDSETETLLQDRSLFAETLSRADHDRELRLYRLLGSADVTDRLRAADVIVAALLGGGGEDAENGGGGGGGGGGGVPEAVLLRHLERRLLRGLASGNEAARVGFSYVLSELLGRLFGGGGGGGGDGGVPSSAPPPRYPGLTFDRVLALLLEKTRPGANVPGQEERDHYFGQLFGLQSFVESGVLFAGPAASAGSRWRSVLSHLLQLGRKKVWLRAQACFVVVQAIARGRLPDEAAVQATLQTLAAADQGALAKTPEGLGIWLAAHARFPAMALAAPWTAPLAAGSYRELVAVLRHEDADAGGGGGQSGGGQSGARAAPAVKQGNASAQLHFVWDLLLNAVLPRPGEPFGEAAAKQLDAFWTTVVDQVYFAKGASDHQKLTGFKIFQRALALCADRGCPIPPTLFSSNLMTCLMNQASNATPRLHRAAVQVLRTVEKQVEDRPAVLPQVLACLLGCAPRAHGVYDFDERVKGTGDGTKPVERILRCAGPDTIDAVVAILRKGALQAPDPNNEQKAIRKYTEYLFRLVGRVAPGSQDGPQQQTGRASVGSIAFQALAEIAYPSATAAAENEKSGESSESSESGGKKKKKNKNKGSASSAAEDAAATAPSAFPALSDKTRAASRQSLLSAAGALLRRPENVAGFCRTVLAIEPGTVGVAMSDDIAAQIAQARQQLTRLAAAFAEAAADAAAARARQGLAVLMAVSLLQLYHEPRADAVEVLQDIEACSEKLEAYVKQQQQQQQQQQRSGKKSKGKTNGTKEEAPAEPDIGQVLTDVLLALLAEASPLTRQTSLQVFEAFAPFLSTAALENLTDVLAAEENMAGYRALFNQEGDDEEDEEDDSGGGDDDDDDDSVVMMDMEADGDAVVLAGGSDDDASEDSDSDSSDSSDSSSDEDEAEDVDDAEQKKLEAALMKTLRVAHLVKADGDGGGGTDDSDGDSDDGSDMSDDAMLALDDQLARHLRLIKDKTGGNKKKDLDEARRKVVAFKHRVLDLLEAYVKHEGGGGHDQGQGQGQDGDEPERVLRSQLPVIRLLLPLALVVRDTKDPALGQKAARIVQEAQRQLKKSRTAAVAAVAASSSSSPSLVSSSSSSSSSPSAEALALLTTLHTAANDRAESRAFAATVSTASLAIASALVAADRAAHYHRVADVYRATQDHWVLDGWSVRPSLFTDWYNWCQSVRAKN